MVAGSRLAEIERWREDAPRLVEEVADDWGLRLGEPYQPGACGYVVRAELSDGTPAVLKVFWPHREAEQEADALDRWDGERAVRLLARDDERSALLLERCEPGTFLSAIGTKAALDVFVALLPGLWKSGDGFATYDDELPYALEDLADARDPRLKDAALAYVRDLLPTQRELVLVHQDLHGENVLAAEREPWLVIDPKPIAAEREYAVAPIVRSPELGHSKRQVLYRLDRLCGDLGLDRGRAIGWTVAQTVAWSGGHEYVPEHIDVANWLLEEA
jgi:streptomycin 6-kinase